MQIWKEYSKLRRRDEWRARFRYNKKTFRPVADTKDDLLEIIAEIRKEEKTERDNKKYNLSRPVVYYMPTAAELFEKVLPTIQKPHQKLFADRVFNAFLDLLPALVKVDEIKKHHFQIYSEFRGGQLGVQSGKPLSKATIIKEIYSITSILKKGALFYESLENWQIPALPDLPKGFRKRSRRERLVSETELERVITELMKPPTGKQTHAHHFHRVRLAHQIEFGFWTGLRRKEIATLKFSQVDERQKALLNVRRWKTDTVTKFFPLAKRAIEIIETRRALQEDSKFIFTPDGKPIESNYRTLKNVCEDLEIPYGRFTEGGFVAHDLRRNFATAVIEHADVETVRELLAHENISITQTYLKTDNKRLTEAIRKRDKTDYDLALEQLFDAVWKGEIKREEFAEKVRKIFGL